MKTRTKSVVSNLLLSMGLFAGTVLVAQSNMLDIWSDGETSYADTDFTDGHLILKAVERSVGSSGDAVLDLQISVERAVGSASETSYYIAQSARVVLPSTTELFPATSTYERISDELVGDLTITFGDRSTIEGTLFEQDFSADVE